MSVDYHAILPELIIAGTIMLVLVIDLFLPVRLKWGSMPIGLLGVGVVPGEGRVCDPTRRAA